MSYYVSVIIAAALATMALRFIPFLLFGGKRETPPIVSYLGRVLPCAVMGMMFVYCLKGVSLAAAPHGLPELISCLVVVAIHVWRRSTILSIIGGTACYMLLVQSVF